MITGLDHVEIVTNDMDASIRFYTEALGFKLTRRTRLSGRAGGLAEIGHLTLGGIMIELLRYQDEARAREAAPVPELGVKLMALRVTDMAKTLEQLRARGIEPSWGPNPGGAFNGIRAEIKDPHGNSIELREWLDGDGPDNLDWQPSRPDVERIA